MKRLNGPLTADCHDPRAFWCQTRTVVLDFRRGVKGDRIGFVNVLFSELGLQVDDCTVHRHSISGRCWIMPPARVLENADGTPTINPRTGRPFFKTVLRFPNPDVRQVWSDRIVLELAARYPEEFPDLLKGGR